LFLEENMSFRDPQQFGHMRRGVRAALQSPNTPMHLRPHLAARLAGGFPQMPAPNPLGNPMQMAAQALKGANLMKPIKTVVGSTAQPVRKTVVNTGAPHASKVVVGNTAQPVRKSMPGSYGGGNKPLPLGLSRSPISAAGPKAPRNPIGTDGNPGKSVTSGAPVGGPPNPVLDNTASSGASQIVSGGMGQTGMPPKQRGAIFAKKRGAFFGA
jgi:hypothetical protein